MAKVNGTPPFVGTVDGVTIYKMGDHYYSRKKSSYGKDEIMAEPSREEHRQNMKGFGYSSNVGREIREQWKEMGQRGMDATVSGRLTAQIYGIQRQGAGEKGFQSIDFSQFGYHMEGFPLTKDRNPAQHFSHIPTWTYQPAQGEDEASITLHFHPETQLSTGAIPEGATYYALLLHVLSLPNYHYNKGTSSFEAQNPGGAVTAAFVESPCIPLPHPPANAMMDTLTVRLPEETPQGQCTIITWGLEYFAEEDGEIVPIETSQSARSIRQTHCHMSILAVQGSAPRPAAAERKRVAVPVATVQPKVPVAPVAAIILPEPVQEAPIAAEVIAPEPVQEAPVTPEVVSPEPVQEAPIAAEVIAPEPVQEASIEARTILPEPVMEEAPIVTDKIAPEPEAMAPAEEVLPEPKAEKKPKEPKKPKEQPQTSQMSLF